VDVDLEWFQEILQIFKIETSSNQAHSHYARAFNSMKAWCPSLEDKERWLMVNFETVHSIICE
jgi:hypothetical protein